MKGDTETRSIIDEAGVPTPAMAARAGVMRTRPAKLHRREFRAANARVSPASHRYDGATVVGRSSRILTARQRRRYFPL